ncbi:protein translocase subunit SecD [Kineococcus gypseus]|uniref:protein translocase subunit SecD n=1 Tax=Kineococcus gypseus TaxID=1637102 RepID=UPI003D7DE33C
MLLVLLTALVFGAVGAGSIWGSARWAPGLALDLEGGTQVVLTPRAVDGGEVDAEQVQRAANIIRQRVDATGLSESQVQVQGGQNISVSIPGQASREQLDLIAQSAQLRMRVVLYAEPVAPPGAPAPTAEPEPTDGATPPADGASPAPTDGASPSPSEGATAPPEQGATPPPADAPAPEPTQSADGAAAPAALQQAAPAPTDPAASAPADPAATAPPAEPAAPPAPPATPPTLLDLATPAPEPGPGQPREAPTPAPADASDDAWLSSPGLAEVFQALDCTDPAQRTGGVVDDPALPLVTCNQDGTEKYVLGPAELEGTQLTDATAAQARNSQGYATGGWTVQLSFDGSGDEAFEALTARISQLQDPKNRFAAVLDGLVVTAPVVSQTIATDPEITGNFTQESADALAQQLKFGALPLSFEPQTEDQISATLGEDQLRNGLIAGLVGLVLVVAYSFVQYRGLALVTVGSLLLAAALNYGVLLLLSWLQGFRLSLAGVAGLIVAIGTTADSFIIYFERVRDEIRDGRVLTSAVEAGWRRARRTILISDAVTLLSAVVLFVLAAGNVRGFAYTLGISTLIDVVVVVLFTHPVVALLARTRFFGGGHKLSGFDPEHLGSAVARHALHGGARRPTVAERRAAERAAAAAAEDRDGGTPDGDVQAGDAQDGAGVGAGDREQSRAGGAGRADDRSDA